MERRRRRREMRGRAAAPDDSRGGRNARWGGPSPDMEPEAPKLLARVRWGNVAWALVAVLAIGLAVAWPRLRPGAPGVPGGAPPTARAAAPPAPTQIPIAPGPAARPPTAPRPPSRPRPV